MCYFQNFFAISTVNDLLVVKIVTLNQCQVVWITVLVSMLLVVKKNPIDLLEGWRSYIFRDSRFNLGI